jgi:ABC-type branched-subunit amino acid transport system permease subunit
MSDVVLFAILGIGAGAAYAVLALGVVVVYKGSNVLNFGQGAVAMFAAFSYAWLYGAGVNRYVALTITVAGSALVGVVLYLSVMRQLRRAPILARGVATLGLLLLLLALATIIWGSDVFVSAPPIFPTHPIELFGLNFSEDSIYLLGLGLLIGGALTAVYRFTIFGLVTRAVAENERGSAYLGYSPDVVAAANWALGFGLAALAGITYAPITSFSITTMSLLIVPALAAALVGRFTSIGLTVLGAMAIGVIQSEITRYWKQPGAVEMVPFVVIIVLMAITGRSIPGRGTVTVARPPFAPRGVVRRVSYVVLPGIVILLLAMASQSYQTGITTSMVFVMVALSLVVVTGYVGQTSLCQMAFAGLGGFAASKLAVSAGLPFPASVLVAALAVVPVGVVIGIPALRLRGINLAVVTLGAAVAVDSFIFQNGSWTGGTSGSSVPSPSIAGYSLDPFFHPVGFGIFVLIMMGLVLLAVSSLRRSGSGRRMLAVRSNERAAAASGISVVSTKLQAFAISAFIAGLAGAILAYQLGTVSYTRFDPMSSITLVIFVYIAGVASVSGALVAGLMMSGGVLFTLTTQLGLSGNLFNVISAMLLIMSVMTQPDGVAVAWQRQARTLMQRFDRRARLHTPSKLSLSSTFTSDRS